MEETIDYTQLLNEIIEFGYKQILQFSIKNPGMAWFLLKTLVRFYFANRKRERWAVKGVRVPPMLIFSVTSQCNLDCQGCYAKILHAPKNGEMDAQKFGQVVQEADACGVSIILLAGGEPFLRSELLVVTKKHPGIIFVLFTNGLLIKEEDIRLLRKQKNVLPILSLEGYELETDKRRGEGVYDNALHLMQRFSQERIFFGNSITITRRNFTTVTGEEFIGKLADLGCKVFFFINFIAVQSGTENLVLTQEQVDGLIEIMEAYRHLHHALFLAFPGSEIDFGGCLAAGKGFVHINAEGEVQPCPFSPYSDANLNEVSLIEAFQSPLLRVIRADSKRLDESNGMCALWNKRAWVAELAKAKNQA